MLDIRTTLRMRRVLRGRPEGRDEQALAAAVQELRSGNVSVPAELRRAVAVIAPDNRPARASGRRQTGSPSTAVDAKPGARLYPANGRRVPHARERATRSSFFKPFPRFFRDVLQWSAGAHLPTLRESEADRSFYSALGAATLVFSCLSGLMFMLAASYATHQANPWRLWWLAILWMLVMICIERTILQISRPMPLVIAAAPRVAISVLIALTVSDIAGLAIYKPEINSYLSKQRAEALAKISPDVSSTYGPKILAVKNEITRLEHKERTVENRIARWVLRSQQSVTKTGVCAIRCRYYAKRAANDRQLLASDHRRNHARVVSQLHRLRAESRQLRIDRRRAVLEQDGTRARLEALSHIKRTEPTVKHIVLLLAVFLVALDLTAVAAKVIRLWTVRNSPYSTNLETCLAEEGLTGKERGPTEASASATRAGRDSGSVTRGTR